MCKIERTTQAKYNDIEMTYAKFLPHVHDCRVACYVCERNIIAQSELIFVIIVNTCFVDVFFFLLYFSLTLSKRRLHGAKLQAMSIN